MKKLLYKLSLLALAAATTIPVGELFQVLNHGTAY
jgi:hypothetical protein